MCLPEKETSAILTYIFRNILERIASSLEKCIS